MHLYQTNQATLCLIPDGPRGIAATLETMRAMANEAKKRINVRGKALELTAGLNQKDWIGEIRRLHAYVRDRVRYVGDVNGVETLQTPEATMSLMAGDCDDKSTLLAALLESISHPARFVAIGFEPNVYCHVYVETAVGDGWMPLETTEDVEAGWDPIANAPMPVRARMRRHL